MQNNIKVVSLFCDGGTVKKNPSPIGGTWAWCAVNESDERVVEASGFVPTFINPITNNYTEFLAMLLGLEAMEDNWSGMVYCDSQLTLGRFFQGWRNKNIPDEFIVRAQQVVNRLGKIIPVHISGHPTKAELKEGLSKSGRPVSHHNVWCDLQCAEQAQLRVNIK